VSAHPATTAPVTDSDVVLEVEDLTVTFPTDDGLVRAVRGVSYTVRRGEALGIVGESGSGKSVTSLAVMGLLPKTAQVTGSAKVLGQEVLGLNDAQISKIRGNKIAMIFQDPLTSLNPVYSWAFSWPKRCRPTITYLTRLLGSGPSNCSTSSVSPTRTSGSRHTRMNSPAACGSGSSSRSRWPTTQM
jgi:ABC-type oligopeptide transport system ATPase subunit